MAPNGCDTTVYSTTTIPSSPSGITTIYTTVPTDKTARETNLNTRGVPRRNFIWTIVTVAAYPTPSSSTCTAIVTVLGSQSGQKLTVTNFISSHAEAQTTVSTITIYKDTTTSKQIFLCRGTYFPSIKAGLAFETTTVVTGGPPLATNKMSPETNLGYLSKEFIKRDLVTAYLTTTLSALTVTQTSCIPIGPGWPGQKETATAFIPYIGASASALTSSVYSSTFSSSFSQNTYASPSPLTTPIASKTVISQNIPLSIIPIQSNTPHPSSYISITPIQPFPARPSITTTIGTNPITIVSLVDGSSALVNSAVLSIGGSATSINSIVFTYALSGLVAISSLTSLPSPIVPSKEFVTAIGSTSFTITELPAKAIVDNITLSAGGSDATINGVELTYASTGLVAVETGTTIQLGGIIMSIFGYTELGKKPLLEHPRKGIQLS